MCIETIKMFVYHILKINRSHDIFILSKSWKDQDSLNCWAKKELEMSLP